MINLTWAEACPGFSSWGADYIFRGGDFCCCYTLLKFFYPLGITHKMKRGEGQNNLTIITKERLVLVSAHYAPHESFYHQGQKHNISNFTRCIFREGICHLCPTAGHASGGEYEGEERKYESDRRRYSLKVNKHFFIS